MTRFTGHLLPRVCRGRHVTVSVMCDKRALRSISLQFKFRVHCLHLASATTHFQDTVRSSTLCLIFFGSDMGRKRSFDEAAQGASDDNKEICDDDPSSTWSDFLLYVDHEQQVARLETFKRKMLDLDRERQRLEEEEEMALEERVAREAEMAAIRQKMRELQEQAAGDEEASLSLRDAPPVGGVATGGSSASSGLAAAFAMVAFGGGAGMLADPSFVLFGFETPARRTWGPPLRVCFSAGELEEELMMLRGRRGSGGGNCWLMGQRLWC